MRLWGVLSSSNTLAAMFSHRENKLNMFQAMNRGSIILINTAKDLLKGEGCTLFGRFLIALIAQATQERSAIHERRRTPTFVYIDEAHDYFAEGEGIELLINSARKYQVGLILSHQHLDQFPRKLQATVMASTAIKMAGGVSFDDARALSREMHTTPEFLQGMKKGRKDTRFGLFIKNYTDEAIKQVIPFGTLEGKPKLSNQEFQALLARNRAKYCAPVDKRILAGSVAVSHAGPSFPLGTPPTI